MNEESFIVDKDLIKENGTYKTQMGEIVEEINETNYKFKFQDLDLIKEWAERSVFPKTIRNKVIDELKTERNDLSVSRPSKRISWGIKVPGD